MRDRADRRDPGRRRTAVLGVLTVLALAVLAVTAWQTFRDDEDPYADYCAMVERERSVIAGALELGPTVGLIRALPSFERLAELAPEDIADDWERVIDGIVSLDAALDAAGVDPATYDREQRAGGVSAEERRSIDAAAAALNAPATNASMKSVQQQALDVCGSPLNL